ncbi:MAG: hypothetical protein P4M12_00395 [Gammaproteobacteria bacterium]|nr:hypothetical protein [Gammaproteobacteria bacterium]
MLSHRLDQPLINAIKNHTPDVLVTTLKSAPHHDSVNSVDSAKFTPLQRVASTGMTEALLWLLNAHAAVDLAQEVPAYFEDRLREYHKTPLYLALEHHQELNAQILLLCGANKETAYALAEHNKDRSMMHALERLQIKPQLIDQILLWAVNHYSVHHGFELLHVISLTLKKLNDDLNSHDGEEKEAPVELSFSLSAQPSLSLQQPYAGYAQQIERILQGLIELALYRNQPELALQLININSGKITSQAHIASAGYWLAIKNIISDPIQEKIKTNAELTLKTLQDFQASGKKDFLLTQMAYPQLEYANLYIETPNPNPILPGLNARQRKIYRAIQYADPSQDALLKKFVSVMTEECLHVLSFCIKEKNYVAFDFLKTYLSNELIFQHALVTQDADLLLAYSFNTNHFMYEIADLYPQNANAALSLLREQCGIEEVDGVSFCIISHGISGYKELRSAPLIKKHKQFLIHHEVTDEMFLRLYFHAMFHRNDVNHLQQAARILHANNATDFIEHAKRFGFDFTNQFQIRAEIKSKLDIKALHHYPTISKNLMSFLDQRSRARFSTLSKSHHLVYIETQLALFQQTLNHLQIELKKLPFLKNRNYRGFTNLDRNLLIYLFFSTVAESICDGFLGKYVTQQKNTISEMRETWTDKGSTCDSYILYERCNYLPDSAKICSDFCISLSKDDRNIFIFAMFTSLVGIFLLFMLMKSASGLKKLALAFYDGLDRFNPMALTELPADFQNELTDVFDQMQETTTEALNLSLQSSVQEARTTLTVFKDRAIACQQRYAFFNAPAQGTPARLHLEEHKSESYEYDEEDNVEMYSQSLLSNQRR